MIADDVDLELLEIRYGGVCEPPVMDLLCAIRYLREKNVAHEAREREQSALAKELAMEVESLENALGEAEDSIATLEKEKEDRKARALSTSNKLKWTEPSKSCGDVSPDREHSCSGPRKHRGDHQAIDPAFDSIMDAWPQKGNA